MDVIKIEEFRVETLLGYHAWERHLPQVVELTLELAIPHNRAGQTDRIRDTVDYSAVVGRVRASLASTQFVLLERLCEHIAELLFTEFNVPWARVAAAKVNVIPGVKRVGVSIERGTRV
jgi:dihydroneopterin aldolase